MSTMVTPPDPDRALQTESKKSLLPPKAWTHLVAGGLGGMCGAIVTSPFDVVKTRLQSSMFNDLHHSGGSSHSISSGGTATVNVIRTRTSNLLWSFVETGHILRDIYRHESPAALFKGLGPTLVGVIPARSINFFTYGTSKEVFSTAFNTSSDSSLIHLGAAAWAGIVTGTATNPIWMVKTRMQLSASEGRGYTSSWQCIKHLFREEGIKGFYKGLTASYLGVAEGTIQWVLYERLKAMNRARLVEKDGWSEWLGMIGAAGTAKMVASLLTYPHEVIRTRLRQPDAAQKYKNVFQTLRVVIAEEGAQRLYGGLSAHLLRVVPNAAVMFTIYEGILRWSRQA